MFIIGTQHRLKKVSIPSIKIGDTDAIPSPSARNIGAVFDSYMNFVKHIDSVCQGAWYHLHNIRRIHKFLTIEATKIIMHEFVTANLNNLNSLLYGLLKTQLSPLQNCAAKIVVNARKLDHVTPILKKLHWLPIDKPIQFSIVLFTYKAVQGLQPKSENRYVNTQNNTIQHSFTYTINFHFQRMRTSIGSRAFLVAPNCNLWNNLPADVKNAVEI